MFPVQDFHIHFIYIRSFQCKRELTVVRTLWSPSWVNYEIVSPLLHSLLPLTCISAKEECQDANGTKFDYILLRLDCVWEQCVWIFSWLLLLLFISIFTYWFHFLYVCFLFGFSVFLLFSSQLNYNFSWFFNTFFYFSFSCFLFFYFFFFLFGFSVVLVFLTPLSQSFLFFSWLFFVFLVFYFLFSSSFYLVSAFCGGFLYFITTSPLFLITFLRLLYVSFPSPSSVLSLDSILLHWLLPFINFYDHPIFSFIPVSKQIVAAVFLIPFFILCQLLFFPSLFYFFTILIVASVFSDQCRDFSLRCYLFFILFRPLFCIAIVFECRKLQLIPLCTFFIPVSAFLLLFHTFFRLPSLFIFIFASPFRSRAKRGCYSRF